MPLLVRRLALLLSNLKLAARGLAAWRDRFRFATRPSLAARRGALGLLLVVLPGLLGLWIYAYAVTPGTAADGRSQLVEIPAKSGLREIRAILAKNGCLKSDVRFYLTAKLLGVARRLKAGNYLVQNGLSPYRILLLLESGQTVPTAVTVPEGATVAQIAEILAAGGLADRNAFLALTRNPVFAKELGLPGALLEGYLFPETYHLTRGMAPQDIIKTMLRQFLAVSDELSLPAGGLAGFSRHEIVTLASIVEKETARPYERSMIAAVFFNRLQRGMPLQADSTVIYGLDSFDGNLTRADLAAVTPYNTYTIKRLPPGPICNPGREAIRAVIQAATVLEPRRSGRPGDYLYFVSKNDGTHYFSKTLAEHNKAVKEYQRSSPAPSAAKEQARQARDTRASYQPKR